MHRIITAAVFASATLSLPGLADACSPLWTGDTEIIQDSSPECLVFDGQGLDTADNTVQLRVDNDCEAPVVLRCDPNGPCGLEGDIRIGEPVELAPGDSVRLYVPFTSPGDVSWTLGEAAGVVTYGLGGGEWSGCDDGGFSDDVSIGCQAAPGTETDDTPAWIGLCVLTLVTLRRLR